MHLRIVHLLSNRWNSAITEYALSCARSCVLLGHEVSALTLQHKPATIRFRQNGIAVDEVSSFSLRQSWLFRQFLALRQPHVIFCYGGPETALAQINKPRSCRLYRVRGQEPRFRQRLLRSVPLFNFGIDTFLYPSASLLKLYGETGGVQHRVISLGVDETNFRPRTGVKLEPTIMILGRLDPVKGHREFFAMFAALKKQLALTHPHLRLLIVGEEQNLTQIDLMEALRSHDLRIGADVEIITQWVDDIPKYLSQCALGVVSSLGSEVICRVAHEFLLCGTPIVVSGAGSLDDVLQKEIFGKSYRGKEFSECVKILKDVFLEAITEKQEQRIKRSAQAREYFSLKAMSIQLRNLLT